MSEILSRLMLGLLLSVSIGYAGYARGSLTRSGWLGAILLGTTIFGFGGLDAALLIIAFFVSSSLLTHYKSARKTEVADLFSKGGQRDLAQTLANGGVAALSAIFLGLSANPIGFAMLIGSLATANADTWATELGVLAKRSPRLITTWRSVARGTSGGVTLEGTLAAMAGAAFIGALGAVFRSDAKWIIVALLAGTLGSLFDSLLGATVQGIYYSDRRGKETEKSSEADGTTNRLVRGRRWIDNDVVNFAATMMGAILGALIV